MMKMKSKSFDADSNASAAANKKDFGHNNTFDFIRFYKTAEETKASLQKYKTSTEGSTFNDDTVTPKPNKSVSKRKKGKQTTVEMTHISIDGLSLGRGTGAGPSTPLAETHTAASTPIPGKDKVKSIMKPSTPAVVDLDDAMDGSKTEVFTPKPKKRNKSVSFMLDDNEQLEIKKTKSEDNIKTEPRFKTNKLKKKLKKDRQAEKENKVSDSNQHIESENIKKKFKENSKKQLLTVKPDGADTVSSVTDTVTDKKKRNKPRKVQKQTDSSQTTKPETTHQPTEKTKKAKKKKREMKPQIDNDEPAQKFPKKEEKEIKPEVIAEDLSNLSIGDNPSTLSSLLDEMTVADKDKRKKLKKKISKNKKLKSKNKETPQTEQQKSEEIKEKKWKRKRWNKDKKVKENTESNTYSVIVDNLPISLLFTYKKLLAEHFAKCGVVRSVGIAEMYPSEVSKPVFTTTVYFDTEDAATKALDEDNTSIEGSSVRVRRALGATLTTAVVRSYGALGEPALSSAFAAAGRVRAIRLASKGRNTMSTAFIEFDGPAAVERAIKMVDDVKIGGKKVHVSKFEIRTKKNKEEKPAAAAGDADHSDNGDA